MRFELISAFEKLTKKYPWEVEVACVHLADEDHG